MFILGFDDAPTSFASLFVWTNISTARVSKLCPSQRGPINRTLPLRLRFCQAHAHTNKHTRAHLPCCLVLRCPRTQRSDNVRHRLAQLRYQLPHVGTAQPNHELGHPYLHVSDVHSLANHPLRLLASLCWLKVSKHTASISGGARPGPGWFRALTCPAPSLWRGPARA